MAETTETKAAPEDYLRKKEEGLVVKLDENYKALNKNVLTLYSLAFVLFLLNLGLLKGFKFGEAELTLNEKQWLLLMPMLIVVPYLLVNNAVNHISRIVNRLKENSAELLTLNPEARPFSTADLEIYAQGIAGMQFQLTSWIVKNFLNSSLLQNSFALPKQRTRKTLVWFSFMLPLYLLRWCWQVFGKLSRSAYWIISLVLLYILPLIVAMAILGYSGIYKDYKSCQLDVLFFGHIALFIFLGIMAIATLWANYKLYLFYFEELKALQTDLRTKSVKGIVNGLKRIYLFYFPPNKTT